MSVMSRWQYREEYLKSDPHWLRLRANVMTPGVLCRKCNARPATDAHHMQYRRIYDVRPTDLIPVCRPCHQLIESAKRVGFIPKEHEIGDVERVSEQAIEAYLKRKATKVVLNEEMARALNKITLRKQQFVCGIVKISHPGDFSKWVGIIITRGKLQHIEWVIRKYNPPKKRDLPKWSNKRPKIRY